MSEQLIRRASSTDRNYACGVDVPDCVKSQSTTLQLELDILGDKIKSIDCMLGDLEKKLDPVLYDVPPSLSTSELREKNPVNGNYTKLACILKDDNARIQNIIERIVEIVNRIELF